MQYDQLAAEYFGGCTAAPNTWPASSFAVSTVWGQKINDAMVGVEKDYATFLLTQLHEARVQGAIVEFGVFEGGWLDYLIVAQEQLGEIRPVLGFDSFQGLPAPTVADEGMGWHQGDYSASFNAVAERLRLNERPYLKLIKGWFRDTINTPEAQVGQVAYARVDCDLYESAVDTLAYLDGKLADGAILVFDDWTFDPEKGEAKAFFEWAPNCPYTFEGLGFFSIGHLYLRVNHARERKRPLVLSA